MKTLAIVLSLVIAGCATSGANYRPLIDSKGINGARYESDLSECQQYATRVSGAAENAAAGAVVGGLFGALIASVAGKGYDRGATTRVGAVTGAASGAASGEQDQRNVIRNCLAGRGYRVLQ